MSEVGREKGRASMVSRRDFLRVGGLSVVGLSVAEKAALARARNAAGQQSCIFLLMTGGPSQLDTFDPKPDAPIRIRGPSRAIATSVPSVFFSEGFPRLAERAGQLAVLRSLCHQAAPIHETGLQLLQTGRLSSGGRQHPSFGSVVAHTLGPRDGAPPYVVLPRLLQNTGVSAHRGQSAGLLGTEFDPLCVGVHDWHSVVLHRDSSTAATGADMLAVERGDEPDKVRRAYGQTRFGGLCLAARQLVERGVRCVTVNLFDSLAGQVTWDCHANATAAPATLYDYRDTLCPQFDQALSALLDDLHDRGLLESTLVVATGEFGRTPYVNDNGGRDHWPGVWSALLAGGGVQGGRVIGASDPHGSEPAERPIDPSQLTATIYRVLGLESHVTAAAENGNGILFVDSPVIGELFT